LATASNSQRGGNARGRLWRLKIPTMSQRACNLFDDLRNSLAASTSIVRSTNSSIEKGSCPLPPSGRAAVPAKTEGAGRNVAEALCQSRRLASGDKYDVLVVAERHDLPAGILAALKRRFDTNSCRRDYTDARDPDNPFASPRNEKRCRTRV